MLSMTLADGVLELTLAERHLSIDVAAMQGVLLTSERRPCGKVGHALVLTTGNGETPLAQINGSLEQLTPVHQRITELLMGR